MKRNVYLIDSVPGSGKTRKIISLINDFVDKRNNPESICAITYTREAAAEMKSRLAGKEKVHVSTIHSLAGRIITKYSDIKTTGYTDVIPIATDIIKNLDSVFKFKTLLIDEAQDMTGEQFAFLKLLGEKMRNIVICGDPMQSIYGFNDGNPDYMFALAEGLLQEDSRREIQTLYKTYRCGTEITKFINRAFNMTIQPNEHLRGIVQVINTQPEEISDFNLADQFERLVSSLDTSLILVRFNSDIYTVAGLTDQIKFNYNINLMESPITILAYSLVKQGLFSRDSFDVIFRYFGYGTYTFRRELQNMPHTFTLAQLKKAYGIGELMPRMLVRSESIQQMENFVNMYEIMLSELSEQSLSGIIGHIKEALYNIQLDAEVPTEEFVKAVQALAIGETRYGYHVDNGSPHTVMTMHSAKGRQNRNVIAFASSAKVLNSREEERVLYVAFTRAAEKLYIFHTPEIFERSDIYPDTLLSTLKSFYSRV